MDAKMIKAVLRHQYVKPRSGMAEPYAYFEEFRGGTGWGEWSQQAIDVWVMALWGSSNYRKIAYEIKVSRSDFLNEIKKPKKRRMALAYSNQFFFICPEGLIKREEIPIECGLLYVTVWPMNSHKDEDDPARYHLRTIVDAPVREPITPNWAFMANICRRVFREEKLQEIT